MSEALKGALEDARVRLEAGVAEAEAELKRARARSRELRDSLVVIFEGALERTKPSSDAAVSEPAPVATAPQVLAQPTPATPPPVVVPNAEPALVEAPLIEPVRTATQSLPRNGERAPLSRTPAAAPPAPVAKPEPKAASTPETKPEIKPEIKPETKPAPKPAAATVKPATLAPAAPSPLAPGVDLWGIPRHWVLTLDALRRGDPERAARKLSRNVITRWDGDNPLAGTYLGDKQAAEFLERLSPLIDHAATTILRILRDETNLEVATAITFRARGAKELRTNVTSVFRFDDSGHIALWFATPDDEPAVDAFMRSAVKR